MYILELNQNGEATQLKKAENSSRKQIVMRLQKKMDLYMNISILKN